jgi:hypothetical protein
MRHARTTMAIAGTAVLMMVTAIPGAASANGHRGHDDESSAELLLGDLSSPKGLAVTAERDLAVAQGAFGASGPVVVFDLHRRSFGTVTPVTDPAALIDVAISPKDGTGWAISAEDGTLLHQLEDGTIVPVTNIPLYQAGDIDPVDQDDPPNPGESNPYGLAVARNGDALVADAAGNDLLRITPDGVVTTMARFDTENLSTDNIPPGTIPDLPDFIDAEAVPTTVTVGPDGAIYVGELKGFPFRVGSSHIWRIKRNAVNASCSVNAPDPTHGCRLYSSGYTAIQDIAFNNNNGRLYVYELAADGVFAFEAALEPDSVVPFPPAVLLEVRGNGWHERRTELAAGQLSQPGGVVVTRGNVYVTDGVFTSGRLLKIDRD